MLDRALGDIPGSWWARDLILVALERRIFRMAREKQFLARRGPGVDFGRCVWCVAVCCLVQKLDYKITSDEFPGNGYSIMYLEMFPLPVCQSVVRIICSFNV